MPGWGHGIWLLEVLPVVVATSTQGYLNAADWLRAAKMPGASVVTKAKTQVWVEFWETMEKDFQSASRKFWQTSDNSGRGNWLRK